MSLLHLRILVGGWGEIEECCICHATHVGGVIADAVTIENDFDIEDEVCNECLKEHCQEIDRFGNIKTN